MELILIGIIILYCFFLILALFSYPNIHSLKKQIDKSHKFSPPQIQISQLAPLINFMFPDIVITEPLSRTNLTNRISNNKYNCPNCKKALVKRNGKFGVFYGCTGYPNCHFTRNINN